MDDSRQPRYLCKVCGAETPYGERRAHVRDAHRELFERQERAFHRNMLVVGPLLAASGALFFLSLFIPGAILGMHVPIWYIVAVFVAFSGSLFAVIPSGAKIRRTYFEPFGTMLSPCPICDARIPDRNLWPHLSSEHPAQYRYLRPSVLALAAFALAFLVLSFFVRFDPGLWWTSALSGGVFLLWSFTIYRWRLKARAAWHATHFETQGRPR